MRFQHGEIGAAAEAVLAGGDDRALDRGIARDLFDDRAEFLDRPSTSITFIERPGMSQVTSAMPSASMSSLKLALIGSSPTEYRCRGKGSPSLCRTGSARPCSSPDRLGIMRALGLRACRPRARARRVDAVDETMAVGARRPWSPPRRRICNTVSPPSSISVISPSTT